MGLRGCVDAWGVAVKREGFTRPSLTEPAVNKPVNTRPVNKAAVNKPEPVAAPAPEPAKPATDRAAYLREYMRARRAKAKEKA